MGHANYAKYRRAFSIAILGLLIIGAGFVTSAHAGEACTASVQKTKEGRYEGCLVKMGNRQFQVGALQSSEEGCSQVCSIMAEVNSSAPRNTTTAKAAAKINPTTYRR